MVDEWPIIEKKIPSFDIVFRPVVDPSLIDVAAGAPPDDERRGAPGGDERDGADPPRRGGGARLPQGGRRPHGAGDHRRDRGRGVRGLPDALRLPEPEPDRARRPRDRPHARGERGAGPRVSSVPGYVVAALVVALALAGLVVQRRSPFAVTGLSPFLQPLVRGGPRGRHAVAPRAPRARDRGLARHPRRRRRRRSRISSAPVSSTARTCSTPGRAPSTTSRARAATC